MAGTIHDVGDKLSIGVPLVWLVAIVVTVDLLAGTFISPPFFILLPVGVLSVLWSTIRNRNWKSLKVMVIAIVPPMIAFVLRGFRV